MPLKPIQEIAKAAGIPEDALEPYGKYKAKISASFLREQRQKPKGKLVLVTAITPTKAGEGKTTTSIALAEGFGKIGQKAMLCLREPSLGPVFGIKGGATGGGRGQTLGEGGAAAAVSTAATYYGSGGGGAHWTHNGNGYQGWLLIRVPA